MIQLTIGYSTLFDRLHNIVLPELRGDREILIIVQGTPAEGRDIYDNETPHPVAEHLQRSDVRVIWLDSRGVAKSRNEALRQARGKYLIFADDDIIFAEDGLATALAHFEANPGTAFILGAAVDEKGRLRKRYPRQVTTLTKFNSAKAATYEMLVRVDESRCAGVFFDENFGAGAVNYLGDEYIFIADLIDKKLKCEFLPVVLAQHPTDSSGSGWGTERDVIARSKIFTRIFGAGPAVAIRAGFALRHLARIRSPRLIAKFILGK
ncbi:MAG: hypothetical protein RLY88_717 [Actinomycetota bacterium]